MKIYFAACGIGLGHAGRTLAIAEQLKNEYEIYFSTYGSAYKFIKEYYLTYQLPAICWIETNGILDVRKTILYSYRNMYHIFQHYISECKIIKNITLISLSQIQDIRHCLLLENIKN